MSGRLAVVIPVLDGARWLGEVLGALGSGVDDVLVIDSGSSDDSVALARDAGARVHELAPGEFGHGRTRNLGVSLCADADLIAFLTQDATPVPGWAAAYRDAFAASPELGAAFGPHLPRPDTSPMIARELTEFFAGAGPPQPWISNVNACYRRSALVETPFADVAYAEDQAFARATPRPIAFVRDAAVLHAHDYGPVGFARRYFDEYRGLVRTTGHVEPLALRGVRSQVAADVRFAGDRRVALRSALHHGSRRVFSALGSRAERLPARVEQAISLEGTGRERKGTVPVLSPPRGPLAYQPILDVARDGVVPLLQPVPGQAEREKLHIAVVIPAFRRGSGGHSTIYNLLTRLEDRGHTVSTWVHDPPGRMRDEWPAVVRANLREFFRPPSGPVFKGFAHWHGADVALATGWETVHPVLRLDHTRARAYLVQDHEPEFFPTSAQRMWAEDTYDHELFTIAASPWLADVVTARSSRAATYFDLAVDQAVYKPRPVVRREDTIVFYARDATERRAVPLGLLALAELHRRRPDLRFVLFGDPMPAPTPFPYEHLGVATPEQLSWAYSEATVGLSLSLTNYSLIPQEMLACGLPCVELSGHSLESVYGSDGPIELAEPDPLALADAVERLLDDPALREQRAQRGIEFVAARTWDHAADQVEAGLREALRRAERHEDDPDAVATIHPGHRAMAGASARGVAADAPADHVASTQLWERLGGAGADQALATANDEERALLERYPEIERRRLLVRIALAHGIGATGLSAAEPPGEVHAMARGMGSLGGDFVAADLIEACVKRAGRPLPELGSALDLGCSSGRVVRVLQALWPGVAWHGCDPNEAAIGWAAANLPGIAFDVQAPDPPLPYPDASFDLMFAISIWSHHAEGAAQRWLAEAHRVLRPGGLLLFTTHGLNSIVYYAETGERTTIQLTAIRRALYRRDFWFSPEFGEEGDWGVQHPEWGTAFLTPEWVLRNVRDTWDVVDFRVGALLGNQDVYVLRRRS